MILIISYRLSKTITSRKKKSNDLDNEILEIFGSAT